MPRKGPARTTRPRGHSLVSLFPEYTSKAYRAAIAERQETDIKDLREAYLHRGLVLYVGAGVSQSIGIPNWTDLIHLLTVRMMTSKATSAMATLKGVSDKKRQEIVSSIQEEVEREASYDKPILMMARALKNYFREGLPLATARVIYRRLPLGKSGRPVYRRRPSVLISSIISLARPERDVRGVQAIVNYNYDDILDRSLEDASIRCLTVRSSKDHVQDGVLPCYHVHGVLPTQDLFRMPPNPYRPPAIGNFVFSEDEYHAEYSDPYKWSNMTQMNLLGRHTGLFVGLSMEDPNIRRLLEVTHRQYPDIPNYAILTRKKPIAHSKDSKPSVLRNLFEGVETQSFETIGVRVIWVDGFSQVPTIIDRIHLSDEELKMRARRPEAVQSSEVARAQAHTLKMIFSPKSRI